MQVGSGNAFADGRNYQNDPNNPSYVTDPGTAVSKIFRYYQSGSQFIQDTNGGAGYTVIDPARYNNNGVLTTVPGGGSNRRWSLQRVFWYPNSATKGIVVYYGNATYDSSTSAIANLPFETFNEVENTKQNAVYLGALALRNNADFTDSTSYVVLPGGVFRAVGGQGGGGNVPTTRLSDLSDVEVVSVSTGDLLTYNGSIWTHNQILSGDYSLTGSLYGTSSYATNALTAVSASFATNSSTASYVLNSVSSSFATNSSTASYVLNAVSASFATTASFVLGGIGSSFSINSPLTGRILLSDGTTNAATASANLYFTGSPNTLIVSSSLVISGSSVFEEDVAINNTRTLAVSNIRPNNETLTISGSVYHESGSFVYTPTFVDYQEKFTTVGIVSPPGNLDLDINNGNVFDVTINGAITNFTISNPPFGGNAGNIVLITTGNGTTYPITWPASVSWPGGTPPTVTSTNGKKDVYGFISLNQGTNWYGFIGGQNI